MGLLSNLSRKKEGAAAAGASQEPADAVLTARTRARQRLIGAAVLVVVGVIGFPLVFETQPRPIPVDIPIVIPRKDGAPPLAMPPARSTTGAAPAVVQASPSTASAPVLASRPDEVITETREQAGKEVAKEAAPAALPAPAPVVAEKAASKPAPKPPSVEPAPKVVAEAKPAAKPADAVRAKALLEGTEPAAPAASGGRFVLQVGAFAEASAARETRLKVEKLGLKTYTQVAETPAGSRIRVRVGPFASREEADKALAKARSAGLSGVVLTL